MLSVCVQAVRGMALAVVLSLLLAGAAPVLAADPAPSADLAAQPDPAPAPIPKPDSAPKPEPAPAPAPKPDPAPAPKPDPTPAPEPTPKPEPAPKPAPPKPDPASKPDSAKPDSTKQDAPAKEDSLAEIWNTRTGDLAVLAKEATTLRASAESMAAPLSGSLQETRAQATRLSSLFQALRGHPMEQLTLVRQMRGLQEKLRNDMKALEDIAAAISQRLEDIAGLQKDMDDLLKDNAGDGALTGTALTELKNYTRTMADAKNKLTNANARLEKILAPARAAGKRLGQTIENTEGSLVEIWKNYYLTPSGSDFSIFAAVPVLMADWAASINTRMRFAYPQNAADWQEASKNFAIAVVVMGLFGFLALRGAHILSKRWVQACTDIFKGAWIGVGGGFSVLAASTNPSGGFYILLVILGLMAVISGVAALSWRLRVTVKPALKDKPSPLNRLIPPAALGVCMLFSDLPPRVLSLAWGAVMLVFLGWVYYLHRKRGKSALPLLERLSYGCAFWLGLVSLLVAFGGYARLAILLFMAMFALVNTCILGNALMALFQHLGDKLFDKEKNPVRNAIAEALSIPAACLLSLLCTVPWLWAVPGARYLLRSALAANYTLGEASFDFSRLLLIVVLFFLVRSFVSLSTTSLNHLPDHMPHIERGVIPPLRTMVRYLSWTLFILIVLGSLGVNFTSLAVVAGGLSVGIGFGVQNLFNNLVSGLILIFGRTILVGDYVDVAGVSGTVKAINIRSTTIETPERALVYVPNSSIMSNQFSNWTRLSRMVRRSIQVGVAYGSDTELVTKLLLEAARKQDHVRKSPPPAVFFTNFGASSLDFTLNVFIDDIDNGVATLSAIRFEMERAFAEHGIDIPFPQLSLHIPETASIQTAPIQREAAAVPRPATPDQPSPT